jgi:chromosome segregation ATPase
MATIQFELDRLYDLVKETQDQKDKLAAELEAVHNTLHSTRELLEEKIDELHASLVIARAKLEDKQGELDELQIQNAKAEQDNYALNHRLESLQMLSHTTYEFLNVCRKENQELEKQIDVLTNGTIKYKRVVDPDDLEEYVVDHKIYLRDVLTDAIYTRHGKLFGYLEEDTGKLVKIFKK